MSSLATVRDSLVIAYSQNIIDDVEFALLYDANMSKPVFPYSKYDIHVDIQIWYPGLGKTQLNFALSSTQHLISFTYDIDIDCKIGGGVNPFLQPRDMHRYAEAIYQHGAPLQNCFGFIDGTVQEIARPKYNQ